MVSEPVERVARALWEYDEALFESTLDRQWDDLDEGLKNAFRESARVAIWAVRVSDAQLARVKPAPPPESDLPDWDDLRGRAPDATGGLSSEAFVRDLRDGWR